VARSNTGFVCHARCNRHLGSFELHHVWPLGYHGPDTKANKIKICPNAHSDIHFLMELMLRGKPWKPREYGNAVRRYALLGYSQVMAYGEARSRALEANRTG
jgi:hypothetical protein